MGRLRLGVVGVGLGLRFNVGVVRSQAKSQA